VALEFVALGLLDMLVSVAMFIGKSDKADFGIIWSNILLHYLLHMRMFGIILYYTNCTQNY